MQLYKIEEWLARHSRPYTYADTITSVIDAMPAMDFTDGPWLAGGALRRVLEGQEEYSGHDFDFWFRNLAQKEEWNNFLLNELNGTITCDTEQATTFSVVISSRTITIQLIQGHFFDSPQEVIAGFDLTNCQLLTDGVSVALGEDTEEHICLRQLVMCPPTKGTHSSVGTLRRIYKFLGSGYHIRNSEIREFLHRVVDNPDSIEVAALSPFVDEPTRLADQACSF